jgi:chromosomal replication initiator protein
MNKPLIFVQLPAPMWVFQKDNKNQVKVPEAIDIINLVCVYFKLSFENITARRRYRKQLVPRQIAMLMIRKYTGMTLKAVASFFYVKDHTTVINSLNTIKDLIDTDSELADHVNQINQLIKTQLK